MRIIGGRWRGLHLAELGAGDPKAHLRPTSDRVREAIFNLLINGGYGNPVQDARVLDLFAGTGALGLEALSRGAEALTLIDDGATARALIARNIALCRCDAVHLRLDATRLPAHGGAAFGLVFLDPPYGKGLGEAAMLSALQAGWLADDALLVWEEGSSLPPPPGFAQLDQRRYGDTFVTIARVA
jgi:16S rRNA (guanine966-N2)-methyltransferase